MADRSPAIPSRQAFHDALAARHGAALQTRFAAAHVAVCGLGGLGSAVAMTLARLGIGHLTLIDFDQVDLSNLHRQQYTVRQLGQDKPTALRDALAAIAPYCDITPLTLRLTAENIPRVLAEADIVCEAFDRAEEKAMLVNTVLETLPQTWLVCGNGMAGIGDANAIRTRHVARRLVVCGDGESAVGESNGLFASRVLVCAAHEAHAVARILADQITAETIDRKQP